MFKFVGTISYSLIYIYKFLSLAIVWSPILLTWFLISLFHKFRNTTNHSYKVNDSSYEDSDLVRSTSTFVPKKFPEEITGNSNEMDVHHIDQDLDRDSANDSNIADFPDQANVLFLAGMYFLESDQNEEAIRYFNFAIILDNSYADAYLYRGAAFCAVKLHEKGLEDFNIAINLNPEDPYPHFHKGLCLECTYKNYKDALKCYDEAIRLSPLNDLFISSRKELLSVTY